MRTLQFDSGNTRLKWLLREGAMNTVRVFLVTQTTGMMYYRRFLQPLAVLIWSVSQP